MKQQSSMGLFIGWKSGALVKYQMGHVMKKNLIFACAKNKDADQSENPCSLIIIFVNRCLDRTMHLISISEIPSLKLEFLAEHTSLSFTWLKKPEGRFSLYEAQMINIECAGTGQHQWSNELHHEITNVMVCVPRER